MHGRIESKTWVTPDMVRLELGGEGLNGFVMPATCDTYVNIALAPPGAPYGPVFDPRQVRERHESKWWPTRRRYTVRSWDEQSRRLTLDFVVHGDTGIAGPWAASVDVGEVLVFEGPGGGYAPDPTADWHLLVGDESAVPAIAAAMLAVPPGSPGVVRIVCDDADHEVPLQTPGNLDLLWLHRRGARDPESLLASSLEELQWPAGRASAFVHGEAEEIRAIRRHLLVDRGLSRSDMSCSPYWRRTMTDEAWRSVKKDFVAAMEADDS